MARLGPGPLPDGVGGGDPPNLAAARGGPSLAAPRVAAASVPEARVRGSEPGPAAVRATIRDPALDPDPPLVLVEPDHQWAAGGTPSAVVTEAGGEAGDRRVRWSILQCTADRLRAAPVGDPAVARPVPDRENPGLGDRTALLEPTRIEPTRIDPTRIDPTRIEPTRLDPTRLDPTRAASAGAAPARATPLGTAPGRATPTKVAQARIDALLGPVRREPDGREVREVVVDGWRFLVEVELARRAALRERARRSAAATTHGGPSEVRAAIPGRVVAVAVAEGDLVTVGSDLLVVEAMKMQNEVRSPRDGVVRRVAVGVGESVELGDLLVVIE